ncbi:hypothetical protein [Mycobacterium sp.]|uniref:hypothetical protein n=1 Tax=Mycobacterium sp. TaxID=1785 RepID=UPI003C7194B0
MTEPPRRDAAMVRSCRMLEAEVWPITAGTSPITKAEREDILGYGETGVCVVGRWDGNC